MRFDGKEPAYLNFIVIGVENAYARTVWPEGKLPGF